MITIHDKHKIILESMAEANGVTIESIIKIGKEKGWLNQHNMPTKEGLSCKVFSNTYDEPHAVYHDDNFQIFVDVNRKKPTTVYRRIADGGLIFDLDSFAVIIGQEDEQTLMKLDVMLDTLNKITAITDEFPIREIKTYDEEYKGVRIKRPGMYLDLDSWKKAFDN